METKKKPSIIRRALVALTLLAIVAVGLFGLAYLVWGWRKVPSIEAGVTLPAARFLSWEEHDRIYSSSNDPYVLHLVAEGVAGEATYVGMSHTADPDDPQIIDLVRTWEDFQPTVALCESHLGLYMGGLRGGVRMFGEAGAQYALARRHDVPLFSLEPTYADEVAALLEDFPAEHVALFFVTRVYWSEQGRDPRSDPERLAMHLVRKRTDVDGLRGIIESVEGLDAIWQRDFSDLPDWRLPADDPAIPAWRDHPDSGGAATLRAIGDADREVRGRHMVAVIVDQVRRGERVLAVVGRSHVIRQEPIFRAALGDANVTLVERAAQIPHSPSS